METGGQEPSQRLQGTDAWGLALGVFLFALLMRVLFAGAGPDAAWPHAVGYKGDAYVWLDQVLAGRAGQVFEAGLPLRPPGMPWLVDTLWDGTEGGIEGLKSWWRVMGSMTCALLFLALLRGFSVGVGAGAALLLAVSQGALVLSHSINSEAPYLMVAMASFAVMPSGQQREPWRFGLFGLASAAACLLRTEHALFVAVMLGWWLVPASGMAATLGKRLMGVALAFAALLAALAPAHLSLWDKVERFNAGVYPIHPATEQAFQRIERRTARLEWTPEAKQAVDSWPGFIRRSAGLFVGATAVHRKDRTVELTDVDVLRGAFGAMPEPIAARPFISSYGPLNFYLAHHPDTGLGFDLSGLREPPPLTGGAETYPPDLIQGLPPERLSLEYLPHLRAFNHGYTMGVDAILDSPAAFAGKSLKKLSVFWGGTALGFGGFGIPIGAEGTRRPVDLATPDHPGATLWRALLAAAAAAGLVIGVRRRETRAAAFPWLLFSATKVVVVVLFFGYARQGVLVQPVVYLGLALAAERWAMPIVRKWSPKRPAWALIGCLLAVLAAEAGRRAVGTGAMVEAVEGTGAPIERLAPDDHAEVRVRHGK